VRSTLSYMLAFLLGIIIGYFWPHERSED